MTVGKGNEFYSKKLKPKNEPPKWRDKTIALNMWKMRNRLQHLTGSRLCESFLLMGDWSDDGGGVA